MKVILAHPTGNANVRAAANSLMETNLLGEFQTTIASFPGGILDTLGALGPFSEIRRRRFDCTLRPVTRTWPILEIGRLIASKVGFTGLTKHETGILSIDSVYKSFDRKVASSLDDLSKRGTNAVYAYEDGAEFSFNKAKDLQLKCFYDLPIGYWRSAKRLLEIEREKKPEWASTLKGFRDSNEKLERKDEELRLADKIYVASTFTAKTLLEFPGKLAPIEVIPYGFPPPVDKRRYSSLFKNSALKVLFVGGLSQRKGLSYLFEAVKGIGRHVELTIVGNKGSKNCKILDSELSKYQWIPSLPHQEILQLMRSQDVLVFPSLFEGFGLVISEAMSQGTPVITTERTAGPDFIRHNENGWLIEASSTEALQNAIEKLLLQPKAISEAGKVALQTAKQRPWSKYGIELANSIGRDLYTKY